MTSFFFQVIVSKVSIIIVYNCYNLPCYFHKNRAIFLFRHNVSDNLFQIPYSAQPHAYLIHFIVLYTKLKFINWGRSLCLSINWKAINQLWGSLREQLLKENKVHMTHQSSNNHLLFIEKNFCFREFVYSMTCLIIWLYVFINFTK